MIQILFNGSYGYTLTCDHHITFTVTDVAVIMTITVVDMAVVPIALTTFTIIFFLV